MGSNKLRESVVRLGKDAQHGSSKYRSDVRRVLEALEAQSDPTVHALAVLGARVLRQTVVAQHRVAEVVEASGLLMHDRSTESHHYTYATPQIAATVAALTQTGGSET